MDNGMAIYCKQLRENNKELRNTVAYQEKQIDFLKGQIKELKRRNKYWYQFLVCKPDDDDITLEEQDQENESWADATAQQTEDTIWN